MTYRQRLLLAFIRQQRSATAQDMAERFSVSRETIRRDVLQLEKSGLVQRYHGGVCLRDPGDEAAFSIRLRRHADKKEKIGAQVARRIPDGATLVLDNSSTVVYVARQLAMKTALTIMTPSLEVAQVAGRHCPDARILLPPGQLRQHDYTLVGPSVLDYFQRVRSDYFIFSVAAYDEREGPMDFDVFEVEFKRLASVVADCNILALDSSKFCSKADIALGLGGHVVVCTGQESDVLF
ncbi:DeoR/GlpR family DNA-binding transcription regulator [Alcaligenes sp. WGS1538]|uniref:DeoR/GlpR family DNA-binding transcription regulator n=1 Tax=Alcaligenes sp. WGS1538 TaxID=3366811 RepID=UPI00372D55E6